MSDLKLFRIDSGKAIELQGSALTLEKPLQAFIERTMEVLFRVRFVTSEHSTGKKHGGRIDSLGIDENVSPVIFEYKRSVNENVINQGLFYLDWLLDHRAEFELLVMKGLGTQTPEQSLSVRLPGVSAAAAVVTHRNPFLGCTVRDRGRKTIVGPAPARTGTARPR